MLKTHQNILKSFVIILMLSVVGCTDKRSPNFEPIQDMQHDPSFKAQDYDFDKVDKRANMLPPPGTNPMSWDPYPNFQNDEQAKNLKNPVAVTKELLAKGQRKFETYCAICHGAQGHGDGTVASKMLVKPPSLINDKIRSWTDGQIFHLVTRGRGLMSGYEGQIPSAEDRWAIVNFIRHLQKTQKADAGAAPATPTAN